MSEPLPVDPPPEFRVVGLTLIVWPGWAETGAAMAETMRSGPILIATLRVLLVSLVSNRPSGPSAFAMMYQVPVVVPAGIVTVVDPGCCRRRRSRPWIGIRGACRRRTRCPTTGRRTSWSSSRRFGRRRWPSCPSRVTESPAPDFAGAASAVTLRSGPILIATVRVLLASLLSATARGPSAFAMMK